jgi:fructokinase
MILCCGEALIDMIPTLTSGGEDGFVPHSGGAVFNTAVSLGRLGVATGFLTGLSTDFFGAQLAADLAESHVDTRFCLRSDLPTTLAFVRLNDGHATYTFYDENTAGRMITPEQLPDLVDEIEALYFGGISLISEPCAAFYAALAARESPRRTIVLDPNIRPGFIRDEARYRARLQGMIAVSDIVKVSDEDLDWIVGGAAALDEKAASLLSLGPGLVVVTRGSAGASAFTTGDLRIDVPAPKTAVVDTVGAGDTFNAGFLAYLAETDSLAKPRLAGLAAATVQSALQKGARVAAVTVSRAGANPPWAHELDV